ncbi:MAG: cache domain-containing protein [Treponema sp.]|nr:cache domain-containing protein [Treponema sp.]
MIITEPYIDFDTKSLVTTIACAARDNGEFRGVVAIDIFLSELNDMIHGKKLTDDGKTFLIDANGRTSRTMILKKSRPQIFMTTSKISLPTSPRLGKMCS